MKLSKNFIIPFKGLKEGIHEFKIELKDSFFEEYEILEAKGGNAEAVIILNKKDTHLELKITIQGTICVECDRCLDYFSMPIIFKGRLIVKYGEEEQNESDEIIIIHPNDSSIDLKQYIFESIGISIPYKKVHPYDDNGEPTCNKEFMKYFNNPSENEEIHEIDPRWSELKKLLKNKKTD